jgi:hypothetical protein
MGQIMAAIEIIVIGDVSGQTISPTRGWSFVFPERGIY